MSKNIAKSGTGLLADIEREGLYFRRTKIVATIGPASSSPAMLTRLIKQGLNVARINFSHGRAEDHLRTIAAVRAAAKRAGTSVAVLGDLCGPKIRVGEFHGGAITLKEGAIVRITTRAVIGDEKTIPSQYRRLDKEVRPGQRILLDDGNLELEVTAVRTGDVSARVVHGGVLKNRKGMNLPDTKLNVSALTAKDRSDALYCIKGAVDYIALSFVRSARDVNELKGFLNRRGADIPVIAKIEKPEALGDIEHIINAADGIMVARGDLGVELPAKKVPIIQNRLIQLANQHNKPVIVATQMLESMIEHSRPTRAEVTDVSAACLAGADAVMLSAETASGKYPLDAVAAMDSILRETEAYQYYSLQGKFKEVPEITSGDAQDAVGMATAQLSRDLRVRSVFVPTTSGRTVRMISADRPAAPIIALTRSEKVGRRLHLLWGVYPYMVKSTLSIQQSLVVAYRLIARLNLGCTGDYIIMLSGAAEGKAETISITVHRLPKL
jgi:pyruvate kinase